ncbi:MAG: hypothetical protein NO110_06215 [Sulfolobales archaeon]|jgi:hypothetical protein|nr:hypothetical protein [Sulfolobales archaeon]
MKAQSEYIGLTILVIIMVIILIPLYLLLINYPVPSAKKYDYAGVIHQQVNGGGISIYFESTPTKTPYLLVSKGNGNYTLTAVYYDKKGIWYNITSVVEAVKFTASTPQTIGGLPQPLIYNFSLPQYVWNYTLVLEIEGFNTTVFATVYPNETAFAP